MDRHNMRNLAASLVQIADAADEIARVTGTEAAVFFGPLARTSPPPAVTGDTAGGDRAGAAKRPGAEILATDRELRDFITGRVSS